MIEKGDTDAIANNKAAIMEVINAGLKRYAGDNVRYVTDVRANAKGYEYLAENLEV